MKLCAYVGPAPVPLEDYIEQTYRQAVTGITVSPEILRAAFSHLVVSDALFNAIGPAIVSGRSVFIYGPPGNGKTAMARSIGDFMNTSGGQIYVPYAFMTENSIIRERRRRPRPRRRRWPRSARPLVGEIDHPPSRLVLRRSRSDRPRSEPRE